MPSNTTNTIIVFSVGVVVVVAASCLGWILVPDIIESQVQLKEGNQVYDVWLDPISAGVPVYMKFNFFNVTNIDKVFSGEETPKVEQLGPYTYSEGRSKEVLLTQNGQITYEEKIFYYFEPSLTNGSLNDVVFTVNPIYFTIASLIADAELDDGVKRTISNELHKRVIAKGEGPYMKHTVDELLFEGWDLIPYVEIYNDLVKLINSLLPNIDLDPLPVDADYHFGYFSTKNGSSSGNFTIESGENGLKELGFIKLWNGQDKIDYWTLNNDPYCNMINGTDGTIYPPGLDTSERIYLFNTDLCRSLYGEFEKEVEQEGVKANRFTIPARVFNASLEENLCFCRTPNNISECFRDSVLDMRPCVAGVPLLMSTPHFLYGYKEYQDAFGLKPDKELHQTHFDLEPASSAPVSASKRIQVNFDVRPYFISALDGKIKNMVFPMFWLDESAKLDAAGADELKSLLNLVDGVDIGRWVFLGCGIALCLSSFIMAIVYATKRKRRSAKIV